MEEELKIINNLAKYLDKKEFIDRDLSSIDRIIQIYFTNNNRDQIEEKKDIEFLFRCLNEKGEKASILFSHIPYSRRNSDIITRLYTEYRYKFEFNLINESIFLTSFDLIKINLKLKQYLFTLTTFIILFTFFWCYQTNQLKSRFNVQLYDKDIQIKDAISAKEKLENELQSSKEKCQNAIKLTSIQEEMSGLKQQFQNEITNIKEKQKNVEDLFTCKHDYEKEKQLKNQLENELSICEQNSENDQLIKQNITAELDNYKEKYEKEKQLKNQLEDELSICEQNSHNDQLIKQNILAELDNYKEKYEKEQQIKNQYETELSVCKQNSENDQLIKQNILAELDNYKEKYEKEQQINHELYLTNPNENYENNQLIKQNIENELNNHKTKNEKEQQIKNQHENNKSLYKFFILSIIYLIVFAFFIFRIYPFRAPIWIDNFFN